MAIDFRYPSVNLNQQAQLPSGGFGPPNLATMFQTGISALADPLVAKMKEEQSRAEAAKIAAEGLANLNRIYSQQQQPGAPIGTSGPSTTGSTGVAAVPSTQGSPAGDDTSGTMGGGASARGNPQVRDTFIGELKSGGLKNPYGLAAVAAYGQRESGWSTGNVNRTWDDLGAPSGGTLSWRGPRLRAMQAYTAGADDPVAAQAQFLLQENPRLIAALNQAKSGDEANQLMANAWRFKGYNDRAGSEFQARRALTNAYANQYANAVPAPQAAPTASFAPQVAPAATPAAAATVTAPAAPQQAPQAQPRFTPPQVTHEDYQREIYKALNAGDKQRASELAAERDQVAAQQQQGAGQPQQAQQAPPPPQQAPGPQSQAPTPQQQQQAQQQQVLGNVAQTASENDQRLEAHRQAGQRLRVASLDPSAGISPALPGLQLGQGMPGEQGGGSQPPPAQAPPTGGMNAGLFDPNPMVSSGFAQPAQTPAQPPPAAAPAAPAGPAGPPPQQPAGAPRPQPPPPVQVAQAQGLPPVVSAQQRGMYDPGMAATLLKSARTPEEAQRILAALYQTLQPPAPSGERFQTTHDANGNWVQTDRLTGATRVSPMQGSQKARETVEIETPRGKVRMQWNPATGQYDIPVGGPPATGPVPVSKEVREAERQLFNDFESTETVKKYRELEQGVQGLKAAFTSGNSTADLVAIVQLFKTIDPGSTVTGAESASVKNSAGVPETLRAMYNKAFEAGGQFSPELRAEIFNTAQRLQQGRVKQVEQHAEAYRRRAKAYELDPDRVVAFEPFKFERATAADFPDQARRAEESQPAGTPRTPGASREAPIDVQSMGAAEQIANELAKQARAKGQPLGKTYFRLPDGRIGVIE